ncbi:hypothetical protein AMJ74_03315, partial [candidate division WOR_3 bacterium SM1_77]
MTTSLLLCFIAATVTGNVYSVESGESLQAHVYVVGLRQVYICDSHGHFTIPDISPAIHELIISHVGFREETLSITIQGPDTIHLHIGLEAMPIPIEDVEATGERIITPGKRMLQKE